MYHQHDWYFWIYKKFYDPPGTPPNKKCVGCKLTAAAGFGILTPVLAYGVYRNRRVSNFKPAIYGAGALITSVSSLLMTRVAFDHYKYNIKLTKEHLEEIRQKRLDSIGQANQA